MARASERRGGGFAAVDGVTRGALIEVEDGDEAHARLVEGNEPDGEGLVDGYVEEAGALVEN